jgi:hypothetical protein
MVKGEWTKKEVQRLKELYPSKMTFDEIMEYFPRRTKNSIRLKASRLGIKRPIFKSMIQFNPIKIISNGKENSSGYIIKCSGCGSWQKFDDKTRNDSGFRRCTRCSHTFRISEKALSK